MDAGYQKPQAALQDQADAAIHPRSRQKDSFEDINLKQTVYLVKDAWSMVKDKNNCQLFLTRWNLANHPTQLTPHNQLDHYLRKKHKVSYQTW